MNDSTTNPPAGNLPVLDWDLIRVEAKRKWMASARQRGGFLGLVENSIPLWLILIALVMLALSAPHTIAMFDRITPGWGWTAPAGVEFGLLYAAFRRKRAERRHLGTPWFLWVLVILLFLTAILVNGAGSLTAAVNTAGLKSKSAAQIVDDYGAMPIEAQVSLFLVPLAALIIPIGTTVAGEGLAALFFDRDLSQDDLETRWLAVEPHELRLAFYIALARAGMRPAEAKRQAGVIASAFIQQTNSAPDLNRVPLSRPDGTPGQIGTLVGDKEETKIDQARRLLAEQPELAQLSLRKLQDRTGINKNTWLTVRTNGNHKENESK